MHQMIMYPGVRVPARAHCVAGGYKLCRSKGAAEATAATHGQRQERIRHDCPEDELPCPTSG